MKRRACLTLLGAASVAATVSGCQQVARRIAPAKRGDFASPLPAAGDIAPVVRLLHRAGFGPAPGDIVRVSQKGAAAYIEEQLNAPTDDSDDATGLKLRLGSLDVLHAAPYDLLDLSDTEVLGQLQQVALLRAVYSKWQLRERMVDFWSNHFNIYARKNLGTDLKGVDDRDVIRAHALGSFPAMLAASARSPAMLGYLDNQQNRKGKANENYARELLELHSLGVGGGYTQKDVQEVARCLTGWTVEDRFLHKKGTFRFDAERHDEGAKTVLGVAIARGGGESDGDRVLDIVSHHPSTARFLAKKLVQYFYGAENPALAAQVATAYQRSTGSIPAMLRPLLAHAALTTAPPIVKRPFDYVVSALRASGAETDGGADLQAHLAKMGQPLFQWPMPDGYPDKTSAWTGSLLARWNFAAALTSGQVKGTTLDFAQADGDALLEALLGQHAQDTGRAPLRRALVAHAGEPHELAALVFASPAFQWR